LPVKRLAKHNRVFFYFTYRSLKDTVAETARGKRVKNVKKIKKINKNTTVLESEILNSIMRGL